MMTEPAEEFIGHQTTRTSVGVFCFVVVFFFSPSAGAPENCKVTVRPLVLPNTAGEKENLMTVKRCWAKKILAQHDRKWACIFVFCGTNLSTVEKVSPPVENHWFTVLDDNIL